MDARLYALWFLLLLWPTLSARADDALEIAHSGNTSAIQSIHTFSCRIVVTQTAPGQPFSYSGEYWRSEQAHQCRYKRGGLTAQFLQQGNRLLSLVTGIPGSPGKAEISPASDEKLGDCDVWMFGLLTFAGPNNDLISFDALLNKPHKVREAKRETQEGSKLIHIKLEHDASRLDFWFDPQVNFLVRKHIVVAKNQPAEIKSELEVTRFKEVAPGIFFPERVENRNFAGSQLFASRTVEFRDIQVNQPIPASVFRIRYPAGTEVADNILGKTYKVNENGNPAGPMVDLLRLQLSTDQPPRSPTREEPQSLTRWILPASAAILVLAGGLWFVRKWKQRQASVT